MTQVRGSTAASGVKTALVHSASVYALNAIPPRPSRRAVKNKPVLESGSASCGSHVQPRSLCSVKDAVPDTKPWPHLASVEETVAVMGDPTDGIATRRAGRWSKRRALYRGLMGRCVRVGAIFAHAAAHRLWPPLQFARSSFCVQVVKPRESGGDRGVPCAPYSRDSTT